MWIFDVIENTWTEPSVKGDTPAARHGHSACIVDHLMYVFGGETFEGEAFDDLYAFNTISLEFSQDVLTVAHRWFALKDQVAGNPSPRWGHTMSTFGKKILLLGGTSDDPAEDVEGSTFVLDTSGLDFPPEYSPVLRNDSIRSTTSEPPLHQVHFASDGRVHTWSGGAGSQSQSPVAILDEAQVLNRNFSFVSRSPPALAPATPTQSPTLRFSVAPQFTASQPSQSPPQANSALESQFQLPESIVFPRAISTLPQTISFPNQGEGMIPPLSINTGVQSGTPLSYPSLELPPASLAPPAQANSSHSEITNCLIDTSDEEQCPPSFFYTPPRHVPDLTLLEFLTKECEGLADKFKLKALNETPPDRESHFSIGTAQDCTYERFIDSGTNSEVFQVGFNHQPSCSDA